MKSIANILGLMAALAAGAMLPEKNPAPGRRNRQKSSLRRVRNPERVKPSIAPGKLISICPGGRHAWHESGFGPIRKPYQGKEI